MPDLLIRNVTAELKERIAREARSSDLSLSEAAKALIEKGLGSAEPSRRLGTELFNLVPAEYRGDDLVFEIPDLAGDPPDLS